MIEVECLLSPAGGGYKGWMKSIDKDSYFYKVSLESKNYSYNKKLQPFANQLRKNMTKAEACLWKYVLKARMMKGYQFRRQRPVLNYIADFMCKELKLIIEVDGLTHTWEETYIKDQAKGTALKNEGFTVLRFNDEEVLNDIINVRITLEAEIERLERIV